jgi:PadR family transcriptional regulator, regulatory protein PadR
MVKFTIGAICIYGEFTVPEHEAFQREITRTVGRNIEPFLLVELLRGPTYGYDLIKRLDGYGFRRAGTEPGLIYKILRTLEDNGSISSSWATRESGAPRRYYEITESGREAAEQEMYRLRRFLERVTQLLGSYTELTGDEVKIEPRQERESEPEVAAPATVGV